MKFPSKYTDKTITAAQKLAEVMCERQAAKDKVVLCWQFWNTDKWKKSFKQQLFFANSLLKVYDIIAILAALKSPKISWVTSLGYKALDQLILVEQNRIIKEREALMNTKPVEAASTVEAPRPAFTMQNNLSKLRKLE